MITAVILAGGRGSRMGGVDKGLQDFRGQPLVQHALKRLQRQEGDGIDRILINANRNLPAYSAMGVPVWPDAQPDEFAGPLAGFLTGLAHCNSVYLLTVPCDCPLFPLDLARRLLQGLEQAQADIAVACAPETEATGLTRLRPQPVFCLLKADLKPSLTAFMQNGGRKIDAWTAQHRTTQVCFALSRDRYNSFFNANSIAELRSFDLAAPNA